MKTDISTPAPGGEVIVYESREGEARVDVRLDQETVWLTQRQMAEVFHTSTDNVSLHLKNIYATGELGEAATTEDFSVVRSEGQRKIRRGIRHYNLDAIISIGYRVNSKRAVRFRQWATRTLREHLVSGYTLNERRLAERGLDEAQQTLQLLARTLRNQALVDETGQSVLDLITSTPTRGACCRIRRDAWRHLPAPKPATSALHLDTGLTALKRSARSAERAKPRRGSATGAATPWRHSRNVGANHFANPFTQRREKRPTCSIFW